MTLGNRIIELAENQNVCLNTIIGKMQSGKTTLSLHLAWIYEQIGFKTIYIDEKFEELLPYLYDFNHPTNIIFDDISFYFTNFHASRPFMKFIAKVYHIIRNKVIINFVIHYSKGILPFLRISDNVFLCSLTTREEIKGLKDIFPLNYLWDYYIYYSKFYYKHPILVKTLNYFGIVKKYIPRSPRNLISAGVLMQIKVPNNEIYELIGKKKKELN
jgi:hypothetical protein